MSIVNCLMLFDSFFIILEKDLDSKPLESEGFIPRIVDLKNIKSIFHAKVIV